jgi:hypothetical protein
MNIWNQRLAIEIGGMFADPNLLDQISDGSVSRTLKAPSMPKSPEKGVLHRVDQHHYRARL